MLTGERTTKLSKVSNLASTNSIIDSPQKKEEFTGCTSEENSVTFQKQANINRRPNWEPQMASSSVNVSQKGDQNNDLTLHNVPIPLTVMLPQPNPTFLPSCGCSNCSAEISDSVYQTLITMRLKLFYSIQGLIFNLVIKIQLLQTSLEVTKLLWFIAVLKLILINQDKHNMDIIMRSICHQETWK